MPDLYCPDGHDWDAPQYCRNERYCQDPECATYCRKCAAADIWCEGDDE